MQDPISDVSHLKMVLVFPLSWKFWGGLRTVLSLIIFLLVLGGKNSNFRGNDHKYTFHGGFVSEIWFPETLHDILKNMRFSIP